MGENANPAMLETNDAIEIAPSTAILDVAPTIQ
jgi:hypothetical protein